MVIAGRWHFEKVTKMEEEIEEWEAEKIEKALNKTHNKRKIGFLFQRTGKTKNGTTSKNGSI